MNGENWNFNVCIWIQVTNAPMMIAVFEIFDLGQFDPYYAKKNNFYRIGNWGMGQ